MKNIKYKFNAWIVTVAVIAAVILLNMIVTTLSTKIPLKIDLTKGKHYELTDETKNALKKLDKDIKISVLGTEDSVSTILKEYITRYKNLSNKLNFTYIDIYQNQALLYNYEQKGENLSPGDFLLECENNYKIVPVSGVISQTFSPEEGQQNYNFELESKMTNAIVTVSGMMQESSIYFLEGHGEISEQAEVFTQVIKTQGHKISTTSIVNAEIPEDAKLLISFVPNADFSMEECERIDKFLENGGNLMVAYTPGGQPLARFEKYLEEWGITPQHNIIIEKEPSLVTQNQYIFIPKLIEHEITKNILSQKLDYLAFGSIGFQMSAGNTQRAQLKSLMQTSAKAIGKTALPVTTTEFEEGDAKGPFHLVVVAEKTSPTPSKVVVVGSAESLALPEQYIGTRANTDFASNLVAYLTGNQENLKIAPKIITEGKITKLTQAGLDIINIIFIWVLPITIIIIGLVIWLRRRYL